MLVIINVEESLSQIDSVIGAANKRIKVFLRADKPVQNNAKVNPYVVALIAYRVVTSLFLCFCRDTQR